MICAVDYRVNMCCGVDGLVESIQPGPHLCEVLGGYGSGVNRYRRGKSLQCEM